MDVIALAQMGIRNAVATLGTATSTHHLSRLFRWVPEIVFCFDGDDAGRTAAWRALQATLPLMEDGRQVRFLLLPDGEDPDTLVRKIGKEEFSAKIDQATAMEDYFFQSLSKDLDITSIEGKARLSNLAKPLIKQFPKGVYGQLILDRLSETLGMSSQSLAELLATEPEPAAPVMEQAPPDRFQSEPPHFSQRTSSTEKLAKYRKPASLKAIELLLHNPEIALSITRDLQPLRSAEDENRKLLLSLIEMIQKDPTTDTYTMAGYCYGTTLGHQLPQLLQSEKITPVEGMEQEFTHIIDSILSDIFKKLELLELKDQLKSRVKTSKAQT
jgi:DNA primase